MKKQSYSGPAGEHLVLGELLRRNHEAYLAHGETQKGWDIVLLQKTGRIIRVQVKAIDWPNQVAVNGRFESGFDVLVIVLLNIDSVPRYLLIPNDRLSQFVSKFNQNRKNNQRTITISKSLDKTSKHGIAIYEDNWRVFESEGEA
jgi:hypothetical protein